MVENLVWATAYNLVAIPVAAGLFLRWGVELPMSVGAIAMSLSTLIVAANAQLLRGLKFARSESGYLGGRQQVQSDADQTATQPTSPIRPSR